jgi:hypothetical protein
LSYVDTSAFAQFFTSLGTCSRRLRRRPRHVRCSRPVATRRESSLMKPARGPRTTAPAQRQRARGRVQAAQPDLIRVRILSGLPVLFARGRPSEGWPAQRPHLAGWDNRRSARLVLHLSISPVSPFRGEMRRPADGDPPSLVAGEQLGRRACPGSSSK